ncbi:MAG: hypothetical protein ACOCV4_06900 [Myxococcota bacterium]
MTPSERLEALGAHHDLVDWSRAATDWRQLWDTCPRGDWLLAIASRAGADHRAVVRAACDCARLALEHAPDGEPAVLEAIETAESWAARPATDPTASGAPCEAAAEAAEAAAALASDPAAQAAMVAAAAAARSTADPGVAATAAASAAQAAVFDAGECAMMAALGYAQQQCVARVRAALPYASVAPLL